jgi:N-acetyl-gamma-glutamyl-phosphate reductase
VAARIFIDGESGTTGLGIHARLKTEPGIEFVSLPPEHRKDPGAKKAAMAEADIVILCLPDDAARESVAVASALGEGSPRILDASTAHRVAEGWVYGFPELTPGQAEKIKHARLVANPGCYATGAIAILRPLVDAGLLPADHPVTIHAVSGYSGGGKAMIAAHEAEHGPVFEFYALSLNHKHVPEIEHYSGLARRPLFMPSVGHYRQGMLVSVPLCLDALPGRPTTRELCCALVEYYAETPQIQVRKSPASGRIVPEALNNTDLMELFVFENEATGHAVLMARLDNLGKGASGAAVQNIGLMLG